MIESLNNGLAARAETSTANRIERIAFDLLDGRNALANLFALLFDNSLGTHNAHERAATGRAFGADRGMPLLLADGNIVLRDQQRDEGILAATAGGSHSGAGHADDLEEIAAVHDFRGPPASVSVTCGAILRGSLLPVATEAGAHIVVHEL